MIENIKEISTETYLQQRLGCQSTEERSLFDLLFMTGARITEALQVKPIDLYFGNEKPPYVNLLTEKNKFDKHRKATFYPQIPMLIQSILEQSNTTQRDTRCWLLTRFRAWRLCRRYFGITDHSFRHNNAIICAKLGLNWPELSARFGWSDLDSARPYLKYNFEESMDVKMHLKPVNEIMEKKE